jgi:hypothetical protein
MTQPCHPLTDGIPEAQRGAGMGPGSRSAAGFSTAGSLDQTALLILPLSLPQMAAQPICREWGRERCSD